jgi:hypothetical protein
MFIAFLLDETEGSYEWALTMIRDLGIFFEVVVHDRDLALMKTIEKVYHGVCSMLCCWHINKNIQTNCRKYFQSQAEYVAFFNEVWKPLTKSKTEHEFELSWSNLKSKYHKDMVDYIDKEWITYKTKFILAWTKKALHLGNLDSSRCEGMHSTLKGYILQSTSDLYTVSIYFILL